MPGGITRESRHAVVLPSHGFTRPGDFAKEECIVLNTQVKPCAGLVVTAWDEQGVGKMTAGKFYGQKT